MAQCGTNKYLFIPCGELQIMVQDLNETIRVRVSKQLKDDLQKLSDKDKRKLSDYIRLQLEEIVAKSKINEIPF